MPRSVKPPLSTAQFRDALCKGFGRAVLQVRHFGSDGLEAELLHACLHNLTHDPFFEGTRSGWLFRLIQQTSCAEAFKRPILDKLKNACWETVPDWDGCLLMGLACEYAKSGSKEAYQVIHEKFSEQQYDPEIGGLQIICLDGLSGLLHVAEVVGARLRNEADFREPGYLSWYADQRFGEDRVSRALRERSRTSQNVAAFHHMVNRQRGLFSNVRDLASAPTFAEFLTAVERDDEVPRSIYGRLARHATADEIGEVFQRLIQETDKTRLISYLQFFRVAELPRLDERIFNLARSDDSSIRQNAITALAQIKARPVGEMGLRLLQEPDIKLRRDGLELMCRNHRRRDLPVIVDALPKEGPPDVLHDLAGLCNQIADRHPQDIELARWVYEHNPCSYCRHRVFRRLIKRNSLSKFHWAECAWDGYEETRVTARRLIRKRRGKGA